jgi:GxxExxY protein
MEHGHITGEIVRSAMRVHSILGPGLLESAYRACLRHELLQRGLDVQEEVPVPVNYDGVVVVVGYRMDLLVERCVVVELKTVTRLTVVHHAQLLSHLKLSNKRVGLLINFHVARLKNGIRRVVN